MIMENYNLISELGNAMPVVWKAGIYCRLSKDDELQGESASISNQREMLENYCKTQGFEVVEVFQDDGYTGLNMDRPGLIKALEAAKDGRINLLITKDASRLGRNYLETGRLMEDFFPRLYRIRYNQGHSELFYACGSFSKKPILWKKMTGLWYTYSINLPRRFILVIEWVIYCE